MANWVATPSILRMTLALPIASSLNYFDVDASQPLSAARRLGRTPDQALGSDPPPHRSSNTPSRAPDLPRASAKRCFTGPTIAVRFKAGLGARLGASSTNTDVREFPRLFLSARFGELRTRFGFHQQTGLYTGRDSRARGGELPREYMFRMVRDRKRMTIDVTKWPRLWRPISIRGWQ
jgi:hypothetical protein